MSAGGEVVRELVKTLLTPVQVPTPTVSELGLRRKVNHLNVTSNYNLTSTNCKVKYNFRSQYCQCPGGPVE